VFSRLSNCRSIASMAAAASLLGFALVSAGWCNCHSKIRVHAAGSAWRCAGNAIRAQLRQSNTAVHLDAKRYHPNTGNINIIISGITVSGAGFGYSSLSPGSSLTPTRVPLFKSRSARKPAAPPPETFPSQFQSCNPRQHFRVWHRCYLHPSPRLPCAYCCAVVGT